MKVTLNGEPREISSDATILELVQVLNLESHPIAVELNRGLLTRSQFSTVKVREGDRIEIVHVVGGG